MATVSPADVQRIAGIKSPVLRNLEITHAYSLLAAAVAERSSSGANWCVFATWASRQAGATIRGEDALDVLTDRLGGGTLMPPLRTFGRWLLRRAALAFLWRIDDQRRALVHQRLARGDKLCERA